MIKITRLGDFLWTAGLVSRPPFTAKYRNQLRTIFTWCPSPYIDLRDPSYHCITKEAREFIIDLGFTNKRENVICILLDETNIPTEIAELTADFVGRPTDYNPGYRRC